MQKTQTCSISFKLINRMWKLGKAWSFNNGGNTKQREKLRRKTLWTLYFKLNKFHAHTTQYIAYTVSRKIQSNNLITAVHKKYLTLYKTSKTKSIQISESKSVETEQIKAVFSEEERLHKATPFTALNKHARYKWETMPFII